MLMRIFRFCFFFHSFLFTRGGTRQVYHVHRMSTIVIMILNAFEYTRSLLHRSSILSFDLESIETNLFLAQSKLEML